MPNKAKDHSAMQKSVCALCFRKPKTLRNISPRVRIMIQDMVMGDFSDESWIWLPTSICTGCYKDLHDCQKDPRYVPKTYLQ